MVWKVYNFFLLEGKVILGRIQLQRGNERYVVKEGDMKGSKREQRT